MLYAGAARGSIVRVKAKAGAQGAEPLGGGQCAETLKLICLGDKIVIKALTEYAFLCQT